MDRNIFIVQKQSDIDRCYSIMKELRPHLSVEDYRSIYKEAHKSDGYELVALEEGGEILAVMGYRFLSDYVRGRHVYVDDLISKETVRSQGIGAELLKYAEKIARDSGCLTLRLCTGIENDRGMKFYERNGWTKRAFAYTKKLSPS